MSEIELLMNEHIRNLTPYSSARDDFKGKADIYLDANESWYDAVERANRYPDPEAVLLRRKLQEVLCLPFEKTVIGNGSDEIIDLLIRIFCASGKDSIMIERPTYGAYKVFADINNVQTINVCLKEDFSLDIDKMISTIKERKPKIVFICSPNNPTGNVFPLSEIETIAKENDGITVIDEAYSDFEPEFQSAISLIDEYPRVCVLKTLSKAWAIAGARVGILVANKEIRDTISKVKPPYNVSATSQRVAIEALDDNLEIKKVRDEIIEQRELLEKKVTSLPYVKEVIPTNTNFILIRVDDADRLYYYLMKKGIIVRNRTHEPLLAGVLRVTVGSERENKSLMEALNGYKP